jgi:hypothetical protein
MLAARTHPSVSRAVFLKMRAPAGALPIGGILSRGKCISRLRRRAFARLRVGSGAAFGHECA